MNYMNPIFDGSGDFWQLLFMSEAFLLRIKSKRSSYGLRFWRYEKGVILAGFFLASSVLVMIMRLFILR